MKSAAGRWRGVWAWGLCLVAGAYSVARAGWGYGAAPSAFDPLPPLVEVRGVSMVIPAGTALAEGPPYCRAPADPPLCIPLRDNEFLSVIGGEDREGLLLRRPEDGPVLDLWFDGPVLRVGGKARTLMLAEEPGWEWLATASDASLAELDLLVTGSSTAVQPDLLERLARENPAIALALMEWGGEDWDEPLATFQPEILWLSHEDSAWEPAEAERAARLLEAWPSLREVWIGGGDSPVLVDALARLPRLQRLSLIGWDPATSGSIPVEWDTLTSLTLIGATMEDLTELGALAGLQELRLYGCDPLRSLDGIGWLMALTRLDIRGAEKLADINALADLPAVRAVLLTGCDQVTDFAALLEPIALEELAMPPEVDPAVLAAVLDAQPGLRALSLHGCGELGELSCLRTLPWLERLGLDADQDTAIAASLNGLRHLELQKGSENQEEAFLSAARTLRSELPGTHVLTAQPVCLGAGEILWLAGLTVLAGTGVRHRRGRPAEAA